MNEIRKESNIMNDAMNSKSKEIWEIENKVKDFNSWVRKDKEDMQWRLEEAEREMKALDDQLEEEQYKFT